MSTNVAQFSYVAKLVALTYQYVELNLTLSAAVRAAEADLRQRHQVFSADPRFVHVFDEPGSRIRRYDRGARTTLMA